MACLASDISLRVYLCLGPGCSLSLLGTGTLTCSPPTALFGVQAAGRGAVPAVTAEARWWTQASRATSTPASRHLLKSPAGRLLARSWAELHSGCGLPIPVQSRGSHPCKPEGPPWDTRARLPRLRAPSGSLAGIPKHFRTPPGLLGTYTKSFAHDAGLRGCLTPRRGPL